MVCNSVQTYIQECSKRERNVQAESLNQPVSRIVYNFRMQVYNCGSNDIRPQFSSIEVSSMSDGEINNPDFITASMNIDSLMINGTGSGFFLKGHQQSINVEMDPLLSKIGKDHSQERKLNTELVSTITVPNNVMVSKSRQTIHDSVQEKELKNMSCPVPIKEYKPNHQLKSSNMSAVEVRQDCAFTGSLNSHENELTFGNQIYHGDKKQITPTEFMKQHMATLIEPCNTGAIAAAVRPSRYLDSERSCPICLKEFSSKWKLKRHYQIHFGVRPFTCNICQQNFTQKSSLIWHKWEFHTCEKSDKCEIFGNIFSRKNNLEIHIRIHTGEKPYKCDTCKKAFTQKPHLIDHVKRRHKLT